MPQTPAAVTVAKNAAGRRLPERLGAASDLRVSSYEGAKYALAMDLALFSGGNQAGTTSSAALATTYLGCCLSNPAASTKNLVLRSVSAMLNVAPAAITSIGLIVGFAAGGITVHTTPLTIRSNKIGNTVTPLGKLDAACTLVGTPAWQQWLSAGTLATVGSSIVRDLEGGLVIPPGGYVAIGTLIATPASGLLASMEWEEVAIPA